MTLLHRASPPLKAEKARPRVVILVKGGVGHNAHVRKSASSLQYAGFEVFVLGAGRNSLVAEPATELEDGIPLRVVPVPEVDVPQHRLRAARQARLEDRRDRLQQRLRELHGRAASGQSLSIQERLLHNVLERRLAHAREGAKRLRESEKRHKAAAKQNRALGDPYDLARYEAAWWPLVRKLRPDVVHVFDVSGLSVGRRAGRQGAHWVYEAHEATRHCGEAGRDGARRRQVTEHAKYADAVITFTAPLAEILVKDLDLPRAPALVHCAPPLRGGPTPQLGLRQAAGVGADDPLLVFMGVLTRQRRLEVVLEAMTMLPDVHLALVVSSEDPLLTELMARGEQLFVSDRVHVVPKVPPESVVRFVADGDVGLIPYARSPAIDISLPNKLFEYLHAGLPMAVSDATATADFVRRHRLGEIAPLHDSRAWAQAIERALQPPHYRDRAAEWQALKEEWCWERQAERLVGVYRELLATPRAA